MCERVFRGNIVFSKEFGKYEVIQKGYLVVADNKIIGVYRELPEKYSDARIFDFGDRLIVPGLVDLGSNSEKKAEELLKYSEKNYAQDKYTEIVKSLREEGVTRAVIEGTLYMESNVILMDLLAKSGLGGFICQTNSDRGVDGYSKDLQICKSDSEEFLIMNFNRYENVKPMLSLPSDLLCSEELKQDIYNISKKHGSKLRIDAEELISDSDTIISLSSDTTIEPQEIRAGLNSGAFFGLSSSDKSIKATISKLSKTGLSMAELFYLATKGGGTLFGKLGSFQDGYEFDAVVLDPGNKSVESEADIVACLESFLSSEDGCVVYDIYTSGQKSLGI